jgi:hypothetical protein
MPVVRHGAKRVNPLVLENLVLRSGPPPVSRREGSKLPLDFPKRVYHTFAERVSKLQQVKAGREVSSPGQSNAVRFPLIPAGTSLAWEIMQGSRIFSLSPKVIYSG